MSVNNMMVLLERIRLSVCLVDPRMVPVSATSMARGDRGLLSDSLAVVTWLPPDVVSRIGLPTGGICGVLSDLRGAIDAVHFIAHAGFIDIIHRICSHYIDPRLLAFAGRTTEQAVAVIDQQRRPGGIPGPTERLDSVAF